MSVQWYFATLLRTESNYGTPGAQRSFYYLSGEGVGDVGTDRLVSSIDYAQQMAQDRANAASAGKPGGYLTARAFFGPGNAPAWISTTVLPMDRITGFDGVPDYSDENLAHHQYRLSYI